MTEDSGFVSHIERKTNNKIILKVGWCPFPPWLHVNMQLQTTWTVNYQVPLMVVRNVVINPMSLALAHFVAVRKRQTCITILN